MGAELADALVARAALPALLARYGGRRAGGSDAGRAVEAPPAGDGPPAIAARYGVKARAVSMRGDALREDLRSAGTVLLDAGGGHYLLLLRVVRGRAQCLTADGRRLHVPLRAIVERLRGAAAAATTAAGPGEHDCSATPVAGCRPGPDGSEAVSGGVGGGAGCHGNGDGPALSASVQALLAHDRARHTQVPAGWLLAPPAPLRDGAARGRLLDRRTLARAIALVACHLGQFVFWIVSWLLLARMIFAPGLASGWVAVWGLCLGSVVLLRAAARWLSGTLALQLGTRIKQRVLQALLALSSGEVRKVGLGAMLATSIDANRLDQMVVNGATSTLLGLTELAVLLALALLVQAWPLVVLLVASVAVLLLIGHDCYRRHRRWHAANLDVTALHTEEMIGRRARKTLLGLAQWYDAEDDALARCHAAAGDADRCYLLLGMAPRAWLLLGAAAALLSVYAAGGLSGTGLVAIIGVVLLGHATMQRAAQGAKEAVGAAVCWRHLAATIFTANAARETPRPKLLTRAPAVAQPAPELVAQDLTYRYPEAAQPLLANVNLHLRPGDRMTLEGPSGGGKSTLARLLSGRLAPTHGSVMLGGLDLHVTGVDGWRRNVCHVPQFHNNHVLTETLLFNLLLGCAWPPTPEVMARVQRVVDAVGLRPLVERMPAGLQQMVGEGGWRLSQGEQARLFLARGLLQPGRLLILDEPFSALDPLTSLEVLDTLQSLDRMLIVITHR